MIQTIQLTPGVVLRHYPDNRFKTAVLSVQLQRPLCREEASLNALLFSVLLRGTAKNPDMRAITARLDGLYGATISPLMRRIGDRQTIGLFLSCLEDRFALPGDQVLAPSLRLVREILLEPKLVQGSFDPEFVESEKKNLIADIEAELNDKRAYAASRMIRSMCAGDSFALSLRGEKEDVEAITAQSLYAHYRKVLRESPVELFFVGSAGAEEVARELMPLAQAIADSLNSRCLNHGMPNKGQPCRVQTRFVDASRGGGWLNVCDDAGIPAAIIEAAFLNNRQHARYLADPENARRYAEAVGHGVVHYLRTQSGTVHRRRNTDEPDEGSFGYARESRRLDVPGARRLL